MIKFLKKLKILFRVLPSYLMGRIFGTFMYDKKYLDSNYFKGKHFGIAAIGWKWICGDFFGRFFLKINNGVPWPVSPRILIGNWKNIEFNIDDINNFQGSGSYFQALDAKIVIGKGSLIAPGVGLITANHDIKNITQHTKGKDIIIKENCWIGMNSVILPGVVLGQNTIVGAGSVVTKSFPEGNCIVAGNPAKLIRRLSKTDEAL